MQFTEKAVCYGVSVTPSIRSNFPTKDEIYLPNLGLTVAGLIKLLVNSRVKLTISMTSFLFN